MLADDFIYIYTTSWGNARAQRKKSSMNGTPYILRYVGPGRGLGGGPGRGGWGSLGYYQRNPGLGDSTYIFLYFKGSEYLVRDGDIGFDNLPTGWREMNTEKLVEHLICGPQKTVPERPAPMSFVKIRNNVPQFVMANLKGEPGFKVDNPERVKLDAIEALERRMATKRELRAMIEGNIQFHKD